MSLQDILGRTAEIRIIDFLSENYGNSYTQWEIYELTGISRNVLYKKLPEMVKKKIIEVDKEVGMRRTYRLANNGFVKKLISAIYEYNLMEAEKPEDDSMAMAPEPMISSKNRYYKDPSVVPDELAMSPIIKKEKNIPLEYEHVSVGSKRESIKRIDLREQYSRAVIAESA
ncbi:hypothetical protein [Methanocella conradii]|uniref:hypothetical protein n=1 Tax=Methanocella conradii TaxID=1175444 RepID=UPI0024B3A81D|nr:hypothetical protein [Methanocella conradii]MDI6898118.1 hypothetical protein [Methanocella conradii]